MLIEIRAVQFLITVKAFCCYSGSAYMRKELICGILSGKTCVNNKGVETVFLMFSGGSSFNGVG